MGLGMRSTRFPSCPLPCLAGSRQSDQIMAQGWFTECPLREGPPCAGRSGASPTALLESAAAPHTCCTTSQQNPPSREGKPPRNGPRVRDVTAGTSRHLPALGQPPPLLWCPLPFRLSPAKLRVDPCGVSRPLRGLPSTRNCLDKGCRSEGSRALHSLPPFEAKHPTDGSFVTAQSANASGICPLPSLNHCGFFHLHKQGKQSP